MGVGNILLGDEGVGVHTVNSLKERDLPDNIDLLDGGTGGFHLLSIINDYSRMILIDATTDDNPIGTIKLLKPKFSSDFPRALTTHDIGLKDLLDTATALGKLPEIHLITVSIDIKQDMRIGLSVEIEAIMDDICENAIQAIKQFNN